MALTCVALFCFVRVQYKPAAKEEFSMETLLGGFRFVFHNRIILGIITLDLFAVLFGGPRRCCRFIRRTFCTSAPRQRAFARRLAGGVAGVRGVHGGAPADETGGPLAAGGGGGLWPGDGRFWFFDVVPGSRWPPLFVAGFADNISVIVRHTLVQLLTPDSMRGRVSSVNNLFIGTSNELGGFESGAVAQYAGAVSRWSSGGVASIFIVLAVAWIWPEIPRFGRLVQPETKEREERPRAANGDA